MEELAICQHTQGSTSQRHDLQHRRNSKENDLNPFSYLTYLFERLNTYATEEALDELLPWSPAVQVACRVPQLPLF